MAGIRHAVVAHKDNINYVVEIAGHQRAVQVFREGIDVFQRIL